MTNWKFYRALHARGMTTTRLAVLAGTGRAHLTQVLNNKPHRGLFTRRRLFSHLTAKEVRLLGWQQEYSRWLRSVERSTGNIVPKSERE